MSAFQLRDDGSLAEIGDDGSVIGIVQPMAAQVTRDNDAPRQTAKPEPKRTATIALTPRDIVKAAKARAKELKAEIKRLESAKRELAQMERLIAAADGRALATVRELKRAAN